MHLDEGDGSLAGVADALCGLPRSHESDTKMKSKCGDPRPNLCPRHWGAGGRVAAWPSWTQLTSVVTAGEEKQIFLAGFAVGTPLRFCGSVAREWRTNTVWLCDALVKEENLTAPLL